MSSITLNAIAIGVFTVTLFSLLGPALHLSPTIPAVTTAGILGLATLDRFLWKGQGGTLVVDWLANRSPEHRDRIVHHEAGHFLVAHLLGIPVTGYALDAWTALQQGQQAQGGVRFEDAALAEQLARGELSAQMIGNYSAVWMAGIAAERLVYGQALGGGDDRDRLRSLMVALAQANPDRVPPYATQESLSILRSRTLLENHQPAYSQLVAQMQAGASVADCTATLQAALSAEPEATPQAKTDRPDRPS